MPVMWSVSRARCDELRERLCFWEFAGEFACAHSDSGVQATRSGESRLLQCPCSSCCYCTPLIMLLLLLRPR